MKLQCNRKILDLSSPAIMAIINVTPDSFFDGGIYNQHIDNVLAQIEKAIEEGAEIIDIGGESTRPRAKKITLQEEMDRVLPVLEQIKSSPVIVSIDTYKPQLMKEAIKIGVDMINDVKGMAEELENYQFLENSKLAYCIMHMLGEPQTMQQNIDYSLPIVEELNNFFKCRIEKAKKLGFNLNQLIIDLGIGFGKKFEHNIELIKKLDQFNQHQVPILMGLSNKSSIGQMIENEDKNQRLYGTLSANFFSLMKGAKILRVHQVKPHKDMLKVWNCLKD